MTSAYRALLRLQVERRAEEAAESDVVPEGYNERASAQTDANRAEAAWRCPACGEGHFFCECEVPSTGGAPS